MLRTTFAGGGGMTQQTTHYFFDQAEYVEQGRLGGIAATVDPSVSWFTLGLVSAWGRRP